MNHLTLYLLNLLRAFPYSHRTLIRLVISSMPTSLISSFCTSGQMFAADFLQIPPHDGHPCLGLYTSRHRTCYGLAPIRECPCWASQKNIGYFLKNNRHFSKYSPSLLPLTFQPTNPCPKQYHHPGLYVFLYLETPAKDSSIS